MAIHTFPLNNHLVIHQPAGQRLFILNPTASWIWQSIADGTRPAELIDQLAEHYTAPREDFEDDVFATLEQWADQGLDPALPNKQSDKQQSGQTEPDVNCLPLAGDICYQNHYHYGQTTFSLTGYCQDLEPYFSPLFASLRTVDRQKTENKIEVFKEKEVYVIACNQVELERTPLALVAVGRVIQAMVEFGYPQTSWMAFVHASAGSLDGQGVIFSGIGGSGKSTLMAALAQSGWIYWCDDTVPLDTGGKVAAIPLNHCLKSGSWDVLSPYYPDLAQQPVYRRYDKDVRYHLLQTIQTDFSATMPVHKLVFPTYDPDCEQSLQPIAPEEGLQRLIDAQTWISPDPAHAEEMIRWISAIPAYSLDFHSLDWAIPRLRQLVGSAA